VPYKIPIITASCGSLLTHNVTNVAVIGTNYRGADKSLARPRRKQATATEDVEFHISYL
jgi:hypothetical protein